MGNCSGFAFNAHVHVHMHHGQRPFIHHLLSKDNEKYGLYCVIKYVIWAKNQIAHDGFSKYNIINKPYAVYRLVHATG